MADTVQLYELRPDSGKRLPTAVVHGLTMFAADSALQIQITTSNGRQGAKRASAAPTRLRADTKLRTLGPEPGDNLAVQLNNALLGGSDYPVMSAVLGTAVGFGTGGAGLIFTVATTALSVSKSSTRALARDGDEIWRVEEIGKVTKGSNVQPTFLIAYFLIDPYRRQSPSHKGWLLHEARFDLS